MPKGVVILIDDEPVLLNTLRRLIENDGYEVETYDDVEAALERAKDNDIDVIVVDINMEPISGITFTRRLRDTGYAVPIIWSSGTIDNETEATARRFNRVSTFVKGQPNADLIKLMTQAIETSGIEGKMDALLEVSEEMKHSISEMRGSMVSEEKFVEKTAEAVQPLFATCKGEHTSIIQEEVSKQGFEEFLRKFLNSKIFWPLLVVVVGFVLTTLGGLYKTSDAVSDLEKDVQQSVGQLKDNISDVRNEQVKIRDDLQIIKTAVTKSPPVNSPSGGTP